MRRTKFRQVLLTLLMIGHIPLGAASPGTHTPFEATGMVIIHNHDGDTIKLETWDWGVLTVRFSGADTPETGQAYWRVARDFLKSQVDVSADLAPEYRAERFSRRRLESETWKSLLERDLAASRDRLAKVEKEL